MCLLVVATDSSLAAVVAQGCASDRARIRVGSNIHVIRNIHRKFRVRARTVQGYRKVSRKVSRKQPSARTCWSWTFGRQSNPARNRDPQPQPIRLGAVVAPSDNKSCQCASSFMVSLRSDRPSWPWPEVVPPEDLQGQFLVRCARCARLRTRSAESRAQRAQRTKNWPCRASGGTTSGHGQEGLSGCSETL